MKIYTRQEFMCLPEGTLFVKGEKHYFNTGICIKGETICHDGKNIDWYYISLCDFNSNGSDDYFEKFDAMLNEKISSDINNCYERDGLYEETDLFLVYEKNDLVKIIKIFKNAI